ncbi:3-dehydroquinate synthase [Petrachloros mirabilis]
MNAEEVIQVNLGERSYDIVVKHGLLSVIGDRVRKLTEAKQIGVITDHNVAGFYLSRTIRSLRRVGFQAVPIVLSPGERSKSLSTIGRILDALAKNKFERGSILLALGGGVIGDLTGFAAAIYQRGISFVQVPTTLVAQVDSSVGGKTGVDHPLGKNLFGAFHQPRGVLVDPNTLLSLPRREWVAGLAEVIKYGIISDEVFFEFLEGAMPALLKLENQAVVHAIKRSCEIKAAVVAEDERESDRRRILNYGHTIGHALESLAGYRGLIHGEAVGIGLVQEADLSAYLGLCGEDVVKRIKALVQQAGLAPDFPKTPFTTLWGAMQHDKKVIGGRVIGVWPTKIGEVVIRPLEKRICAGWFKSRAMRSDGSPARSRKPFRRKVGSGERSL